MNLPDVHHAAGTLLAVAEYTGWHVLIGCWDLEGPPSTLQHGMEWRQQ